MSELYRLGLRGPRCNGCSYAKLKHELGDRFYSEVDEHGWTMVYELEPEIIDPFNELPEKRGKPAKFRAGFMSIGHSDECYNWQPPEKSKDVEPDTNWINMDGIWDWWK